MAKALGLASLGPVRRFINGVRAGFRIARTLGDEWMVAVLGKPLAGEFARAEAERVLLLKHWVGDFPVRRRAGKADFKGVGGQEVSIDGRIKKVNHMPKRVIFGHFLMAN